MDGRRDRSIGRTVVERSRRLPGLLLGLLVCAVPPALSSEGRIPLFQQTVLNGNERPISGKYVVTRNITVATGKVIDIIGTGNEDVEIDLNGFTLQVGGGMTLLRADNLRTLIVRNGVLEHLGNADVIRVTSVDKLIVEGNSVYGGRHGIYVDSGVEGFIVRNNTIGGQSDNGILASATNSDGAAEIADGLIESNVIKDTFKRGIEARFGLLSVAIVNNRIENAGTYGITANSQGALTISDNKINGTGFRGLIASRTTACRISGNVVKGAGRSNSAEPNEGGDGIFVNDTASNCLLLNNVSSNNWMSGLRVEGSGCHIDRNVLNHNGLAGLHLEETATLNTLGRNTVRGNKTRPDGIGNCVSNPGCAGLAEPEFCDESPSPSSNTSFGDNLAPGPPPC